jgi:hypothetical protein
MMSPAGLWPQIEQHRHLLKDVMETFKAKLHAFTIHRWKELQVIPAIIAVLHIYGMT